MGLGERILITAMACSFGLATPARVQGLDGRYQGSITHFDVDGVTRNDMLHLYDAQTDQILPKDLRMILGLSLRYRSEPGIDNTGLFGSRFFGDVRGKSFRLQGQFTPWQRVQPGSDLPRRREGQFGLDLLRRNWPSFSFNYIRRDRDTGLGESKSEDARAQLNYAYRGARANVGVRRIETTPAAMSEAAPTKTDEIRGGFGAGKNWRRVLVNGSVDGFFTRFTARERRIDQTSQRVLGSAAWRPNRKFSLAASGFARWNRTDDNNTPTLGERFETSFDARAGVFPARGLTFALVRQYRRQTGNMERVISDYMRFEAVYRRLFIRRMVMQTGYMQTFVLASESGQAPTSDAFLLFDGELRRHIGARAELRASRSPVIDTGLQWRRVLQLRTLPSRRTRFDVLWQMNTLPAITGPQQVDRSLEFLFGYKPLTVSNFTVSYRRREGEGRVDRSERFWSFNAGWRTGERTVIALIGSRVRNRLGTVESLTEALAANVTFWAARVYKLVTSYSWSQADGLRRTVAYGINLTRTF
jgi:hypothetical protein